MLFAQITATNVVASVRLPDRRPIEIESAMG
jgi:hypothetical protein